MRNRTSNSIGNIPVTALHLRNNLNGTITTVGSYQPHLGVEGESRLCLDHVTPQFKARMARGEIINNSFYSAKSVFAFANAPYVSHQRQYLKSNNSLVLDQTYSTPNSIGTALWQSGFPFFHANGDWTSIFAGFPSPSTLPMSSVVARAFAKANETDVLLLVTMAEAKKTLDSIGHAANAFTRIKRYLKRLRPRDFTPSGALRQVGIGLKVWLEVRYGLLPTYYDVISYAKHANGVGKKSRIRFESSASGNSVKPPYSSTVVNNYSDYRLDGYRTWYNQRSAGVLVEPFAEDVSSIHSLGIDRVASSAWELVPLSFIIDWFVNTSTIIAAHEGRFGQRVLASWSVERDIIVSSFAISSYPRTVEDSSYRYVGEESRPSSAVETFYRTVRIPNPSIPVLPSFQVKLNWKKCLDLVAIASSTKLVLERIRI